jgi:polyvinyl alcohol dehydrogenase (cytochrome)
MIRVVLSLALAATAGSALAQTPPAGTKALFTDNCAFCHDSEENGAPLTEKLKELEPAAIVEKLTTGTMAGFAASLSAQQKREIAEFVTGKKLP